MAFDPDHWIDEEEQNRPSLVYFLFAAGPRQCIGDRFAMLEAQLILITPTYHLELVSEPLDLAATLTTRSKQPIEMTIHER